MKFRFVSSRQVDVRPISSDDWPLFRSLRLASLEEAPDAFSTRFAQWRDAGEARWRGRLRDVPFNAVGFFEGMPAGIVGATHRDDQGGTTLVSLWVTPAARGKGVGEALVAAVVAWAQAHNLRRVNLDVREANARAVALYERCGFAYAGPVDQAGPPECRMVREL
jgi:RimJ/RimL family protein N-acetyltransferase